MKRYIKASSDNSKFDAEELCVSIVMCHMGADYEECEEFIDSFTGWDPEAIKQYMKEHNYDSYGREIEYLPIGEAIVDNYTPQEALSKLPGLLGITPDDAEEAVSMYIDDDGNWDF